MMKVFIPYFLLFLISMILVFGRSSNIEPDEEVTCDIDSSDTAMARYISAKYGKSNDLNTIHEILYRHGYYLRNFYDNSYVYVSTGEGSKCFLGRYIWIDTALIIVRINPAGLVSSISSNYDYNK